ncbi:MAG: hybrid sensor histidine kinase/response regulator, partial [Coriobacteriales bacterium]|nr:hybrid sensor histidine kinase/response regulator [Coriobacteriales bacterium]
SFFEALDAIVFLADNGGENVDSALDLAGLQSRLTKLAGAADEWEDEGDEEASPEHASAPAGGATTVEISATDASAEPLAADTASDTEAAKRDGVEALKAREQATIRIRTAQVDSLLNLVSEVVISQIKAEQRQAEMRAITSGSNDIWLAWQRIRAELASNPELSEALEADITSIDSLLSDHRRELATFLKSYSDDVSRASVVINDVQEQGMQLRMLPAHTIFQTFPRAVRDLAKQFKKEIDLDIEGGDTELDKKVLEEINDPLIHIIRNSVDHGIESPEKRREAGKPDAGTIRISARQEGDRIVIEVSDDGRGIDPDLIRSAAVRKGYLTEAEASSISDREAIYLIFEAGFSTAAIITEISGRGVGMDVVREFVVEKLKGSLDVESEIGVGTTFRLTLPLTLAIIRALMLRVGDQVYALPTSAIEETLRMAPSEIQKVEGREVIRRQRRTVPVVHLSEILGVPEAQSEDGAKLPIVTLGYSGHRMGFQVDSFVGEQQIVIKPLGSHLAKIDNVAGVTILGAGEVVPILNIPDLMYNARTKSGQRVGRTAVAVKDGVRRILICEDSFTTRELERSIFEAAGYDVETAVDGAQGLSRLRENMEFDAVVTDVQMPNMNGFDLTRAIKRDPQLKAIPVIIVTSLERDEEKAEGIDAGADAYITKSVFNQDTLLDTVESLIR